MIMKQEMMLKRTFLHIHVTGMWISGLKTHIFDDSLHRKGMACYTRVK